MSWGSCQGRHGDWRVGQNGGSDLPAGRAGVSTDATGATSRDSRLGHDRFNSRSCREASKNKVCSISLCEGPSERVIPVFGDLAVSGEIDLIRSILAHVWTDAVRVASSKASRSRVAQFALQPLEAAGHRGMIAGCTRLGNGLPVFSSRLLAGMQRYHFGPARRRFQFSRRSGIVPINPLLIYFGIRRAPEIY